MRVLEGKLVDSGIKVGIVAARFNEFIVSKLVAGAKDGLVRHDVSEENIDLAWVPGAFEIPLIASKMAKSGKYDAVICLGAVIRGATSHYDYVCSEVSKGIANVSLASDIPVVVLTWSIDTVNAVSWLSVLSATICVSPSFLHKSPLIGMHISPFPYVAMKFTFSVVANSAAHIRSPSFSLLSSSETSISFPSCKSLTASSTVLYSNIFFYLPFPLIF